MLSEKSTGWYKEHICFVLERKKMYTLLFTLQKEIQDRIRQKQTTLTAERSPGGVPRNKVRASGQGIRLLRAYSEEEK